MSATYLVEVVNFDDLRPGDRVLHQGAPVTIATVGCNLVMPAIVEAIYISRHSSFGMDPTMPSREM